MTRILDRQKAIKLRKQGKTYTEIRRELGIAKSTLSNWLSKHPLTKNQMKKLERSRDKRKLLGIEKTRITKARKRENRLRQIYIREKKSLLPLADRELYLSGLFLYWGEGVKGLRNSVSLNNTDPQVLKFYLYWLSKILKVSKNKIRVTLHLYEDMDPKKEIKYWSGQLKIPKKQFNKPYIKSSKRKSIDHKGYGHGTCGLYICDTRLKERISLGIEAIANYYSRKLGQ